MAIDKDKSKIRKSSRGVTIPKRAWDSGTILKVTAAQREHSPLGQEEIPPPKEKKSTRMIVRDDPYIRRSDMIAFLKENLKIKIMDGGFTDPNNREVRIIVEGDVIATANFDVVQKREYEG